MKNARGKERVPQRDLALQVVPLIDIMFLLLLFFMLGADMSQRENPELALPRADVPVEIEPAGLRRLVANIRHAADPERCVLHEQGGECRDLRHWKHTLMGLDIPQLELERTLADAAQDSPERSDLHVLLRADLHAPYGEVQQLIQSAARAGLSRLELAAARR